MGLRLPDTEATTYLVATTVGRECGPLIRIVPDARFAIIIFANGSRHLTKTAEKAMQMFLGPPGKPETIASESLPVTQVEMSGYLGTYENERVMTLFLKDSRASFFSALDHQFADILFCHYDWR